MNRIYDNTSDQSDDESGVEELRLSAILRKALKGKRLSQVALEAGIPKSLLHDWVSAARKPSGKNLPHLRRLARHLGLTLDEVLFGSESGQRTIISTTRFSDSGHEYLVSIEKLRK